MVNLSRHRERIEKLAEAYKLDLLLFFGSRLTGNIHNESDYDIGYLSRITLTLDEEGALINDVLPVVGAQDERALNLVNIRKATPLLLYAMTSRYQTLYERKEGTCAGLQAYAFKKYLETKPLYEERARRMHASSRPV